MSWDYVCDETGGLVIIVTRWYNLEGNREERLIATGFEPYEPVSVEVIGAEDQLAVKPFFN